MRVGRPAPGISDVSYRRSCLRYRPRVGEYLPQHFQLIMQLLLDLPPRVLERHDSGRAGLATGYPDRVELKARPNLPPTDYIAFLVAALLGTRQNWVLLGARHHRGIST